MPTELKSLQQFFSNRVFRIPDYQRGYAWGLNQLGDFWQDLKRLSDNRNHYTGQLTLEAVPKEAWQKWDEDTWLITGPNYKPFYIVDGQQRLTTAVILLKCLLDAIPDDSELAFTSKAELIRTFLFRPNGESRTYLFGYEKDNPSYEYLKTQILGQTSNAFDGTETVYTTNLLQARDYFKKQLKDKTLSEIEDLFKRLTQRFVFNEYELDADLDVFVAFETMNNRGKPLSKLELLKNRLIYLSTLLPVDIDQQLSLRRNINDVWKTVYKYLGMEAHYPLDDDDFLRAHWIISFNYARDEADQFAKFLLDEHFTPDQVIANKITAAQIQAYIDSVQNGVKAWHAIHYPHRAEGIDDTVLSALERLGRVGRGAFAPLAMAALQKNAQPTELTKLLNEAERFMFLVGRLCKGKANTGDSDFYRLAGYLHRGNQTLAQATSAILERTKRHFSLEKAQLSMRELFDEGEGFYSWSGRHYFLFEYEQYLRTNAGMNAAKLNWDQFRTSKGDNVTIEHIYPQTPKTRDWPGFDARSPGERNILKHSLGNLLALSQSRNSSFSNRAFAIKKQDADGVRGYFNGSYSEIEVAKSTDWTPENVLDRGLTMLGFLENRWNINLGGRPNKVFLLYLEFLEPGGVSANLLERLGI